MCESLPDKQAFLIFGMHRSGTSALAGSLQEAGVFFVDDPGKVADNPKGSYENPVVWKSHDALMERHDDSEWYNPSFDLETDDAFLAWQMNHVMGMCQDHNIWGVKDPRSILFAESWVDAIMGSTHRLKIVGIFRHPSEVIASIRQRDPNIEINQLMPLWTFYNRHLLYWYYRFQFPLLDFSDYRFGDNLKALCKHLDLPNEPTFYEFGMVNHYTDLKQELPSETDMVYKKLLEVAWPS